MGYTPAVDMLADGRTKALCADKFQEVQGSRWCCGRYGMNQRNKRIKVVTEEDLEEALRVACEGGVFGVAEHGSGVSDISP